MSSPPPIICYALVARGAAVLAEHSAGVADDDRSFALRRLENLDSSKPRDAVDAPATVCYTLADPDGVTYLALADKTAFAGYVNGCLDDLRGKWRAQYGDAGPTLESNSATAEFGDTQIAALLRNCNSQGGWKIQAIKRNLATMGQQTPAAPMEQQAPQ